MPEIIAEERLDEALKALASPQRRALLALLSAHCDGDRSCCASDEDICACDLAGALDLAPSTISHHMRLLVRAGLVRETRKGLWVHYRVDRGVLTDVAKAIAGL